MLKIVVLSGQPVFTALEPANIFAKGGRPPYHIGKYKVSFHTGEMLHVGGMVGGGLLHRCGVVLFAVTAGRWWMYL
jgi:hypothetical protein